LQVPTGWCRVMAARRINASMSASLVAVRPGNRLVVSSSTFTQESTGQRVATRAPIGGTNDPVNADGRCAEGCFTLSEAYIAADGPLQPNTAYRVNLAGTNNGVAFTRQFTFTTGAGG